VLGSVGPELLLSGRAIPLHVHPPKKAGPCGRSAASVGDLRSAAKRWRRLLRKCPLPSLRQPPKRGATLRYALFRVTSAARAVAAIGMTAPEE
jgi:hypothetical protein